MESHMAREQTSQSWVDMRGVVIDGHMSARPATILRMSHILLLNLTTLRGPLRFYTRRRLRRTSSLCRAWVTSINSSMGTQLLFLSRS
jgi:hypothetical protein